MNLYRSFILCSVCLLATMIASATEPGGESASKSARDYFKHRTDLAPDPASANDAKATIAVPKSQPPPEIPNSVPPGTYRLIVAFVIEENGSVKEAVIMESSGNSAFDDAHIRAVKRWKYRPAKIQGKAVAVVSKQPFMTTIQ